jgi:hypothetical protein
LEKENTDSRTNRVETMEISMNEIMNYDQAGEIIKEFEKGVLRKRSH